MGTPVGCLRRHCYHTSEVEIEKEAKGPRGGACELRNLSGNSVRPKGPFTRDSTSSRTSDNESLTGTLSVDTFPSSFHPDAPSSPVTDADSAPSPSGTLRCPVGVDGAPVGIDLSSQFTYRYGCGPAKSLVSRSLSFPHRPSTTFTSVNRTISRHSCTPSLRDSVRLCPLLLVSSPLPRTSSTLLDHGTLVGLERGGVLVLVRRGGVSDRVRVS